MTVTWKITSFTYLGWITYRSFPTTMLPLVNYYKEHWKVCKEINLMPGTFPLHKLIKKNIFQLHTITPQCFGFSHLNNDGIVIRKTAGPHMSTHTSTTIFSGSKVRLIQAIAVHVGGKGRVQERFEILSQEPPSD